LHRKQISNVFYFKKHTENKKKHLKTLKKCDKNKKNVKKRFYIYALYSKTKVNVQMYKISFNDTPDTICFINQWMMSLIWGECFDFP